MSATEDSLQTAIEYIDDQQASLLTLYLNDHNDDETLGFLFTRALESENLECAKTIIILKGVQAFLNSHLGEKLNDAFIAEAEKNNVTRVVALQNILENHRLILDVTKSQALLKSARNSKIEVSRYLLTQGANPNVTNEPGNSALHLCTLALIEKLKHSQDERFNELEKSYFFEKVEALKSIINSLIEKGGDPELKNNDGKSALEIAALSGSIEVFSLLNPKDRDPRSTLLWACQQGYLELTKTLALQLKEQGGDSLNEILSKALFAAVEKNDHLLVALLLELGANYQLEQGKGRLSAVRLAFNHNHKLCAKSIYLYLQEQHESIDTSHFNYDGLAYFQKLDAEAKDNQPLILASMNGHLEEVESLLDGPIDINSKDSSGKTALFYAAIHGNVPLMALLINRGASINLYDTQNTLPITYAIERKQFNAVKLLIQNGANLELRGKDSKTLYEYALSEGERTLAELLFKEMRLRGLSLYKGKASRSEREKLLHESILSKNNSDPAINLVIKNVELSSEQKISEIKVLIEQKGALITSCGIDGKTPITLAIEQLDLTLIAYILEVLMPGKKITNTTLLHFAAENGFDDLIELLVHHQTTPSFAEVYTEFDEQQLQKPTEPVVATSLPLEEKEFGRSNLDKSLPSANITVSAPPITPGVIVSELDENGISALEKAIISEKLSTITLLLSLGACFPFQDKKLKDSIFDHPKSAYQLYKFLREQGKNIESSLLGPKGIAFLVKIDKEKSGFKKIETPLIAAVKENNSREINRLISLGAFINDIDNQGMSPLHWAIAEGNMPLIEFLVQQGAELTLKSYDNLYPIHRAALLANLPENRDKQQTFEAILEYLYFRTQKPIPSASKSADNLVAKFRHKFAEQLSAAASDNDSNRIHALVGLGVDVNERDQLGQTAFIKACKLDDSSGSHADVISSLVHCGANPFLCDNKGKSALEHALSRENFNLAKVLLTPPYNLDLNHKDADGKTPLICAIISGKQTTVTFILERTTELDFLDKNLKSALMHAIEQENNESINAILDRAKTLQHHDEEGLCPIDFDKQDKEGSLYIHLAAQKNNTQLINRLLLDFNVNIDQKNKYHRTALHLAAGSGNLTLCKHLVARGANIHALDLGFRSPLDHAIENSKVNIVEYFAFLSIYHTNAFRLLQNHSNQREFSSVKKSISEFRGLCLSNYLNGLNEFTFHAPYNSQITQETAVAIFNQVKDNLDSASEVDSPFFSRLQEITHDKSSDLKTIERRLEELEFEIETCNVQRDRCDTTLSEDSLDSNPRKFSALTGLNYSPTLFKAPQSQQTSEDLTLKQGFREWLFAKCLLDLKNTENRRLWSTTTSRYTYTIPGTTERIKVPRTVKEVLVTLDRYKNKYSYQSMLAQLQDVARDSEQRKSSNRKQNVSELIGAILHPEELEAVKARTYTY